MARLQTLGWEVGALPGAGDGIEFVTVAGAASYSTAVVRSGTYSGAVALVSGSTSLFRTGTTLAVAVDYQTYYFRTYLYIDTAPLAENRIILFNDTATVSSPAVWLTMDSNSVLR